VILQIGTDTGQNVASIVTTFGADSSTA